MPTDLYEVLQVSPNAERDVIEGAYIRLTKKYHPDVNPSPDATERMKAINAAYEVLHDPVKRAQYDRSRIKSEAPKAKPPPEPAAPPKATYSPPPKPAPAPIRTSRRISLRGVFGIILLIVIGAGAAHSLFNNPTFAIPQSQPAGLPTITRPPDLTFAVTPLPARTMVICADNAAVYLDPGRRLTNISGERGQTAQVSGIANGYYLVGENVGGRWFIASTNLCEYDAAPTPDVFEVEAEATLRAMKMPTDEPASPPSTWIPAKGIVQPTATANSIDSYLNQPFTGDPNTVWQTVEAITPDYSDGQPCDSVIYKKWANGKSDQYAPNYTPTPQGKKP